MFDNLEEFINNYNKANEHAGGKCFLQRYHKDNSKEEPLIISWMAFMNASGNLDRHNNPVYFMCTHHPLACSVGNFQPWVSVEKLYK